MNVEEMNMSQLKDFISSKESEIKEILMKKVSSLQKENTGHADQIKKLTQTLDEVKNAYQKNLQLLNERDADIKQYEDKFDAVEKIINDKDNQINLLKQTTEDLNSKLKYEKAQRNQNDDYIKFTTTKLTNQHKEEVSKLSLAKEKVEAELKQLRLLNVKLTDDITAIKKKNEEDAGLLKEEIEKLKKTIEAFDEKFENQKAKENELNLQITKLTNDNIEIVKVKIGLEEKMKNFELKEQENFTNLSLAKQKVTFVQTELSQTKDELSSVNNKNELLIKQLNDLKNEIFAHKQTIQLKDFEIEKEKFSQKLQNEKVNDLSNTIDKMLKDKSSYDSVHEIQKQKLKEKIDELENENSDLKKKVKELSNINLNIPKSNDNSVNDAVEFFNNNGNFASDANTNANINEIQAQLKEKDLEIQRIKNEYEIHLSQLNKQIEEYKSKETSSSAEASQYKVIVENLEKKVAELDSLYQSEKNKIKEELNSKIKKLKNENKKLKDERDKLVSMCSDLKIEVNRLENNLSLTQNIIDNADAEEYNCCDENEYDEIKKKTNDLLKSRNDEKMLSVTSSPKANPEPDAEVLEKTREVIGKALKFAENNISDDHANDDSSNKLKLIKRTKMNEFKYSPPASFNY